MPHVRCIIVRLDAGRPVHVTVARPGDELMALIEVDPGPTPAVLTVEVCRGDTTRHRWPQRVQGPTQFACRLHWQDRPTASSRLAVHIWCGDTLLASRVVLLLPRSADAQGRLPIAATAAPASAGTRLAFQDQLRALLDERP